MTLKNPQYRSDKIRFESTNPFSGAFEYGPLVTLLGATSLFNSCTETELLFKFVVARTLNASMVGLQKIVLACGVPSVATLRNLMRHLV